MTGPETFLRLCKQVVAWIAGSMNHGRSRAQAIAAASEIVAGNQDGDGWTRAAPFGDAEALRPGLMWTRPGVIGRSGLADMAARWMECGMPVVEMGDRLAASLMCTVTPSDAIRDVRMPWPAFAVATRTMALLVAECMWGIEWYVGTEESRAAGRALSLIELAEDKTPVDIDPGQRPALDLERRLILGACVEMDMYRPTPIGARFSLEHHRNRSGIELPSAWVFRAARDVRVDLRRHVAEFLSGTRRGRLALQHCVRGHRKRQRCGAGGLEHKWVHIEPYWRGPRDAVIAERSHRPGSGK